MKYKNQPDRWEATLLAVVMAIAGAPFLFATLGSLMKPNILTSLAVHNSPVLLAMVGAVLVIADRGVGSAQSDRLEQEGDHDEL